MLLLLLSCAAKSPEVVAPAEPVAAPPPPAKIVLPISATELHMTEHFTKAIEARDALVRYDGPDFAEAMAWIADHPYEGALPGNWKPFLDAMQAAGVSGRDAQSGQEAGTALGELASACGACHLANNATPELPYTLPPEPGEGLGPHMRSHGWAMDRMWESVVSPSDEAWGKALEVLTATPLSESADGGGLALTDATLGYAKNVHRLAAEGADTDAAGRAVLFGEIAANCADCHGAMGATP